MQRPQRNATGLLRPFRCFLSWLRRFRLALVFGGVLKILDNDLVHFQHCLQYAIGLLCFAPFFLSPRLWIAWGWYDRAYALIGLQFFLAALNARGIYKNE